MLERVYQEYGITNGLKEMNPVMWGPDYRLDGSTILVESWTSFDRHCQGDLHLGQFEDRLGLVRAVKPCACGAPLRGCGA